MSGRLCGAPAGEVDHIVAGDDHDDENLQALCSWHHSRKTSKEGNAALAKKRAISKKKFIRSEDHPGLI